MSQTVEQTAAAFLRIGVEEQSNRDENLRVLLPDYQSIPRLLIKTPKPPLTALAKLSLAGETRHSVERPPARVQRHLQDLG